MSVETRHKPDGTKVYVARWRDIAGQQRSRQFDRKADATEHEAEMRRTVGHGCYVDLQAGELTVGEWADTWLGRQLQLKEKTKASYRSLLNTMVLPTWRDVPLAEVSNDAVADWVAAMCEMPGRGGEDMSASRVRQAYHLLTGMLDDAVDGKQISTNAARHVELPRLVDKGQRIALTHDQLWDLADACGPHRLLVLLLGYTGLRWGELTGLQVKDVYVDRSPRNPLLDVGGRVRIFVSSVMSDVNGKQARDTPKSHQRRWVDVPEVLEAELIARLEVQRDDDLVFPARRREVPIRVQNFRRDWYDSAAVSIGVPGMTIHQLRHTAATLAIDAGANVRDLQRMLGHKSAASTLDRYGHLLEDRGQIAEAVSRAAVEAQERRMQRDHSAAL
jgi:integrase